MLKNCRAAYEEWVARHPNTVKEMGGEWTEETSHHWHDFRQGWRFAAMYLRQGHTLDELAE